MNLPNKLELISHVYVAGWWENKKAVKEIQNELRKRNFNITHDWTVHEEPNEGSHEEKAKFATWDIDGARQANFLVAVPGKTGTRMEMGVALGVRIPIFLIGWGEEDFKSHLFFHHPLVSEYKTKEDFFLDLDSHLGLSL